MLRKVTADYDVILIDCQLVARAADGERARRRATAFVIPLECEFFALRGVALLIETIDKVRDRLNPTIELDGVLATMYDPRTLHSREVLERVVEAFGNDVLETVDRPHGEVPGCLGLGRAHHRVRARARGARGRTCGWRGSWSRCGAVA